MKLKVVSRQGQMQVLEVEVDEAVVAEEFARAYNRYGKELVVPGFRKGRAPRGILRARFGDRVKSDVQTALMEAFTLWALSKQNLRVVDVPRVEAQTGVEENKPFVFRIAAKALVVPEIRGYERLEVNVARSSEVADEQVEEVIDRLREKFATLVPAEGPDATVSRGDCVVVDLRLSDPDTNEVVLDRADNKVFVPSSEEELLGLSLEGKKVGERLTSSCVLPKDFHEERLRSKKVVVEATVKGLKKVHLPPKDDTLAQMATDCSTLEELRERVRQNLQHEQAKQLVRKIDDAIFEKLIQLNPIDIPWAYVEAEVNRVFSRLIESGTISRQMPNDQLVKLKDSFRPAVKDRICRDLITGQIALQEGIDATDEEVEAELARLKRKPWPGRDDPRHLIEKVKARLEVRSVILDRKVMEYLYKHLVDQSKEDEHDEKGDKDVANPDGG